MSYFNSSSTTVTTTSNNGIGFGGLLFLVFLVLKLTHVIDWSWWWVTSPLWVPFSISVIIIAIVGIVIFINNILDKEYFLHKHE